MAATYAYDTPDGSPSGPVNWEEIGQLHTDDDTARDKSKERSCCVGVTNKKNGISATGSDTQTNRGKKERGMRGGVSDGTSVCEERQLMQTRPTDDTRIHNTH